MTIVSVAMFLIGTALGIFALLAIGIRHGDRSAHLAMRPHTRTDAIARRFVGLGIRHASSHDQSERG